MKTASLIIFLFAAVCCVTAFAEGRKECSVCGMYLDLYEKTEHVIYFKDGSSKAVCSLHCAARLISENRGRVTKVMAADFSTKKLIDAKDAFYVEGSDVPGVMSYTSRIAFSSRRRAEAFRKKHGGRILSFDRALSHQMEDER